MVHESDYQKHQSVPSQKNLSINKLQRACSTIDKGFNKVRMTTGHRAKEPMPQITWHGKVVLTDQKEGFRASERGLPDIY